MSAPSKKTGASDKGSSTNTTTQGKNGGKKGPKGGDESGNANGDEIGTDDVIKESDTLPGGLWWRDPDGIYLSKDEVIQQGPDAYRVGDNKKKHAPFTPKGTKFHWDANQHVSVVPPVLGVKSKVATEITMFDETGTARTFVWARRAMLNFANEEHMRLLQLWRKQLIKRKLDQNDDGQSRQTTNRQHWTDQEKDFIKHLVLKHINKHKRYLDKDDWRDLAVLFNARFKGWSTNIGEATPPHKKSGKDKLTTPSIIKKVHIRVDRPWTAIRSQAQKYADVKEAMFNAVESFRLTAGAGSQTSGGIEDGKNEQQDDGKDEQQNDEDDDGEDNADDGDDGDDGDGGDDGDDGANGDTEDNGDYEDEDESGMA